MSGIRGAVGLCLAVLLGASSAVAQAAPQVCSVTKAIECDESMDCGSPTPTLVVPTFLHVDVEQGVVTILAPEERRGETTRILGSEDLGELTVLTGIQEGKGWSMVIAKSDGAMSLAVSDEHVVFAVFGRCVAGDALSP